jgi:hypothetical protein
MRRALDRLYLHSHVAAFCYERPRVDHASEGFAPSGDAAVTVAKLVRMFDKARTHRARLLLIKEAQTEARGIEHAPERRHGSVEWKAAIVADARPYRVIAIDYGISPATISRIKKAARQDRLAA